ncbi:hypothetical protein Micbo1qcDRAFT_164407 [Microdochium bolleyi]|uniref:Letm1 RBD domain-containing protein n=1 Tax=Microdochium bolleyi TaxID=196109 RepID=A0A136J0U8_9PEZI|nr:hypothetical protein Micbo1qcDRAFT_164407 [Microdochium bolleyi]
MDSPFSVAVSQRAVASIAADDRRIKRDGGVGGLIDDEVVLACEDRGMNIRGQEARDLRRRLDEWVRTTTRGGGRGSSKAQEDEEHDVAAEEAVRKLLLSEEVVFGKGGAATEKK